MFSGEFWSGKKAKELGLVDEIGNANQVLREKFGKDVVIKNLRNRKVGYLKNFHPEENIEKLLAF